MARRARKRTSASLDRGDMVVLTRDGTSRALGRPARGCGATPPALTSGWRTRSARRRDPHATRTRVDRKTGQKVTIKTGKYAPTTLNDWLAVARVVFIAAKKKYGLPVDPMADVEDFPLKGHRTYTKEEPNALTPEETAVCVAGEAPGATRGCSLRRRP